MTKSNICLIAFIVVGIGSLVIFDKIDRREKKKIAAVSIIASIVEIALAVGWISYL